MCPTSCLLYTVPDLPRSYKDLPTEVIFIQIVLASVDDMDRITIETGMQDISAGSCIKFVPRTHEANFLDIQPRYGWEILIFNVYFYLFKFGIHVQHLLFSLSSPSCWSFLGQTGGNQVLSLQTPGCMWSGIAAHEFMHALGFVHEQSRSDRDHYVTIVWKNIMPGLEERPLPCNVPGARISSFRSTKAKVLFLFWQNTFITSGNRSQIISTARMTTALSCITDGELLL